MNIVKGISAIAIIFLAMIFMGLVGVDLAYRFGPGMLCFLPAIGILVIVYGWADSVEYCSIKKELKEQGLSDQSIESVKRGLKQSAKGETHDLGDFAKYTEEEDD